MDSVIHLLNNWGQKCIPKCSANIKVIPAGSEIYSFLWAPSGDLLKTFSPQMANCGRQQFSPENARFELFYGYQKATTARSCVCVSSIIFRFRKQTVWRENVSDLECNKETHLPLCLLKISVTEKPVSFCRTRASMLLPCHVLRTSPLHLFTESLFFRPQYVFYEKPQNQNVPACEVMEVVNGKTPFTFILKTSAG